MHRSGTIKQPNHLETVIAEVDVDGERHLVKFTRYHDNQQFWTVPGERDERIHRSKTFTVTEPEPDEYELYDLTVDPYEERNLAHPTHADDRSRRLEAHMFELLVEQLAKKRLVPEAGEVPGYRPPVAPVKAGARNAGSSAHRRVIGSRLWVQPAVTTGRPLLSRVFLFALTAALNPTLLAATTVMLLLPNPRRLLLGYLLGAYTTGITIGLAIEYWLHGSGVVSTTKRSVSPVIDVTIGLLLILVAFVVATGRSGRRGKQESSDEPKKTPRWQRTLSKGSARSTFVVGVLLSFPGASYLAALTEIDKQNLGAVATVLTVIAVNVIMLALLELPLIGYTVAPDWTSATVERLKAWLGRNGRRALAVGAAAIGAALIVRGVIQYSG